MNFPFVHVNGFASNNPEWSPVGYIDNITPDATGRSFILSAGARSLVAPVFGANAFRIRFNPALWMWATFEYVDNVNANEHETGVGLHGKLAAVPPKFQKLLSDQGSVFRYYELVGTQWPVQPGFPAFGGGNGSAPESIAFKAPGRVVPVYLVNTTMESHFQKGNQPAGPLEEDDRLPPGFLSTIRPTR